MVGILNLRGNPGAAFWQPVRDKTSPGTIALLGKVHLTQQGNAVLTYGC